MKTPKAFGHILFGSQLTKGAEKVLDDAQRAHGQKKIITHISDEGIQNLENAVDKGLPKPKEE